MHFDDFCRDHGLLIEQQVIEGRWVRVATTDHPRKRNGAYKVMGAIGWCQNHAMSPEVSKWTAALPQSLPRDNNAQQVANAARHFDARMQAKLAAGWTRAAERAERMLSEATQATHSYLQIKGLADLLGLVAADGALLVPMRHCRTNVLAGAQIIRWLPDERQYEKKMLPGMRAMEAVFRLGLPSAKQTWLVEGYATGLSVRAAIKLLCLRDAVLVCFSAGNLARVAPLLRGARLVFADHDANGTGQHAAVSTGLPYCMSSAFGDANDMHQREGIFKVASLMMDAMAKRDETAEPMT